MIRKIKSVFIDTENLLQLRLSVLFCSSDLLMDTFRYTLIPQSSLYETTGGVPLVRVLSLPCIIDFKNLPLLRRPISGRFIRWMDGWMDGWMSYLPLKFLGVKKSCYFFRFF